MNNTYVENGDGVHVMGPTEIAGGEYTLCGDAFDIAETERDFEPGPFRSTKKRIVTCPACVAIIKQCRGIKISE